MEKSDKILRAKSEAVMRLILEHVKIGSDCNEGGGLDSPIISKSVMLNINRAESRLLCSRLNSYLYVSTVRISIHRAEQWYQHYASTKPWLGFPIGNSAESIHKMHSAPHIMCKGLGG